MNRILRNLSAVTIPLAIIAFLAITDAASVISFAIMFILGTVIASLMEDKKLVLDTVAKWAIIISLTFGIVIFSFSVEFTFNSIEYYFFIYGPPISISLISYPITRKWTTAIKSFGIILVLFLSFSTVIFLATGVIGDGLKLQSLFIFLWVMQSVFVALLAHLVKKAKNMALEKLQKSKELKGRNTPANKNHNNSRTNKKHKNRARR